MAPELRLCQARSTTPAGIFNSEAPSERTGVSTDDHGWQRGAFNAGRHSPTAESITSSAFGWGLGYFFMRDVLSDGEHISVVLVQYLVGAVFKTFSARLYNVSGTYKWRIWNVTDDAQVGTDSAAQAVGSTLLVNLRHDAAGNQLDLFVDGSNVKSVSQTLAGGGVGLSGASSDAATDLAYWSAWCLYFSASDDLNEAHYPEMRLLNPNAEGAHDEYNDGIGGGKGSADFSRWKDLENEGSPDDATEFNDGEDENDLIQTSGLTTHAMTNTIMGLGLLYVMRQNQVAKTVVHGSIIRHSSTDKVLSWGSQDIGTSWGVREAVFHTSPTGNPWSIGTLEAGHRRDAGSSALAVQVTALGVVVVALGSTNLAPPDPPDASPRGDERRLLMAGLAA